MLLTSLSSLVQRQLPIPGRVARPGPPPEGAGGRGGREEGWGEGEGEEGDGGR